MSESHFLDVTKPHPFLSFETFSWFLNTLVTWWEELTHWKRPWCWRDWRQVEKGTAEGEMLEWHPWLNDLEFEQALGDEGQGSLLQSMGSQRVGHDWAAEQQQQWIQLVDLERSILPTVQSLTILKFLIFGLKVETPNSIFMPFPYNSCPNSPFTSDKHTSFDIEFSPSGTLPSYEYVWQTGILDALDW